MIKTNRMDAKVYELLEDGGEGILVEVEPEEFGHELSFMSEALNRLNQEMREAFSNELNKLDE